MKQFLVLVWAIIFLAGCNVGKDSLKKTLEENPDILTNAIEKNPTQIMEALNNAVRNAQKKQFEDREKEAEKERENEFANPKQPKVDASRIIGKADAPVLIVEYSDFECPFCKKGYETVNEVKKKYGDKVKFLFKHLPLDFHPLAMPAAKYYEAVAMQSIEKANKFHDIIFQNQDKLKSKKEEYLKEAARAAGADMGKVKADLDSAKVKDQIQADMDEARTFGFSGTPGFLINGVSIKGAYPAEEFEKIIEKIMKK